MNTSKVAVVASTVFGKVLSIIGYVVGAIMLLMLLTGLPEENAISVAVFGIIIVALSVLAVIKGAQIKRQVKRFKKYIALISGQQMTSLENIAASTNQPVEFVAKDIQQMIKKRFFAHATIDTATNEIVIVGKMKKTEAQVEMEAYVCSACDATGEKPKGASAECEYCGSPV